MTLVNTSAKVRKIDCSPDVVALIDVLLASLIFSLGGSSFLMAPGVSIELPTLPLSDSGDLSSVTADISVLNARGDNMIIFDGAIYSSEAFSRRMKTSKEKPPKGAVLLIKADKSVGVQTLVNIARAARNGGFDFVQLAAKPSLD